VFSLRAGFWEGHKSAYFFPVGRLQTDTVYRFLDHQDGSLSQSSPPFGFLSHYGTQFPLLLGVSHQRAWEVKIGDGAHVIASERSANGILMAVFKSIFHSLYGTLIVVEVSESVYKVLEYTVEHIGKLDSKKRVPSKEQP
jgi:hypothetical protein